MWAVWCWRRIPRDKSKVYDSNDRPDSIDKRQRVCRLVRHPIKTQLPTAVQVACCFFPFVVIIIKISPSRRDKRHCGLLSVLEIGDIHTEVIRGISGTLRFLFSVPIPSRRTQENRQIDVSGDIRPRTTLKLCLHPHNCWLLFHMYYGTPFAG